MLHAACWLQLLTAARFQWYWAVRRDGTSPKEGEVQLDVKADSEPEQLLRTFKLKFTGDAWSFCLLL